jgi:hypothetical protein
VPYHEAVQSFAPEPVIKNAETMCAARAYIKGLRVRGGTRRCHPLRQTEVRLARLNVGINEDLGRFEVAVHRLSLFFLLRVLQAHAACVFCFGCLVELPKRNGR